MNEERCDHTYEAKFTKDGTIIHIELRKNPPWHGIVAVHNKGYYLEIEAAYCPLCGKKLKGMEENE